MVKMVKWSNWTGMVDMVVDLQHQEVIVLADGQNGGAGGGGAFGGGGGCAGHLLENW